MLLFLSEACDQVHWKRENDCRVLLSGDGRQRLQVAQLQNSNKILLILRQLWDPINYLKSGWRRCDDIRRFLQSPRRILFTFSGDDLSSGLSWSLSFGGHGSLQLNGQADVLAVIITSSSTILLQESQLNSFTFQHAPLWRPMGG